MSRGPVRVLRLGLRPYAEALRAQERCVEAARAARLPVPVPGESVVLSEPAEPVYAWGLRGGPEAEEAARLRRRGAGLAAVRRGGRITFHGPGQLLAFPVLDLRRRRLPLRGYVEALEALVLRLCRRFGLPAARALPPPFTGVWMGDSKLCAIGGVRLHLSLFGRPRGLGEPTAPPLGVSANPWRGRRMAKTRALVPLPIECA
ncbi:putative lipoyltransferase 2, mitochondrial isoform X2 [Accipiter gentilis]|uniref:putative lipoyltransferase 2, mitochondrial isoform X2 n=1 Tax=Astur gentilis TaxID=8957 RepID=UPI00210FF3AB|nr:putative lipoyltransferase 2, mitochondrial isoform X2 [Accipiter gentilis]